MAARRAGNGGQGPVCSVAGRGCSAPRAKAGGSAVKNDHKSSGVLETSCGDFLNYPLVTQNHTPGSHLISKKTDHVKRQCLHIRQWWMCVLFIQSEVVVFAQ